VGVFQDFEEKLEYLGFDWPDPAQTFSWYFWIGTPRLGIEKFFNFEELRKN
jgi:hypothetical protein